jgi:hypothetical protein
MPYKDVIHIAYSIQKVKGTTHPGTVYEGPEGGDITVLR